MCTRVDPGEPYTVPTGYRRPDGASVFTRSGTTRYTHPLVLAPEHRLLDTHADLTAPVAEPIFPESITTASVAGTPGTATSATPLAEDQARVVHAVCTSGRRLEILVGPAGSGKTTTLKALRQQWERTHGPGSVIGLAPSANAARELTHSLAVPCENTAKWLHETHPTVTPISARRSSRDSGSGSGTRAFKPDLCHASRSIDSAWP